MMLRAASILMSAIAWLLNGHPALSQPASPELEYHQFDGDKQRWVIIQADKCFCLPGGSKRCEQKIRAQTENQPEKIRDGYRDCHPERNPPMAFRRYTSKYPTQQERTAQLMAKYYRMAVGTLPGAQEEALLNALRGKAVTPGSGGGFAAAGRAVAAIAGVGNCTRHFYNPSIFYWAIALVNAGHCKVDGTPGEMDGNYHVNVCMVPPKTNATLRYHNSARIGAKVVVASYQNQQDYGEIFNLREVGCHIEAVDYAPVRLNQPADGDVTVK